MLAPQHFVPFIQFIAYGLVQLAFVIAAVYCAARAWAWIKNQYLGWWRIERLRRIQCRLLLSNGRFVSFGEPLLETDVIVAVDVPSLPRTWKVEVDGLSEGYEIEGTCWHNKATGFWEIFGFSMKPLNQCSCIVVTIIPRTHEEEIKRFRWRRRTGSLKRSGIPNQ